MRTSGNIPRDGSIRRDGTRNERPSNVTSSKGDQLPVWTDAVPEAGGVLLGRHYTVQESDDRDQTGKSSADGLGAKMEES